MAVPPKVKGVHGIAWLALLGAILIAVAFPIDVTRSWPPRSDPNWPRIWYSCLLVVILAVASCFFRKSVQNQLVATIATGFALALAWFPLASFFANYHTYPWLVLAMLGLVSVVGGLVARAWPLSCVSLVCAALWLVPVLVPEAGLP